MAEAFKAELTVRSDVEELEKVRDFVSQAAKRFGFEERDGYNIVLAVDEACSNIIRHGYDQNANAKLRIAIETIGDSFVVTLNDSGKTYDLRLHQLPDMPAHLAARKRGGLGIMLIRSLVDDVEYERIDGENKLVLIKRRPASR
ncbi:MAG: ATP-binding protein [Chloroherpetonaceae bacterium]|nr:ATP-binding protein [Chloroherpetonaceae bacterium]MDW8437047.1 ATP-binding protein [Chloroherpetonaceae bacterium]